MTLGANLPTWPALVFTYFEPITTILGAYVAFTEPVSFVSRQLPGEASLEPVPQTAVLLAHSIGGVFLLLAAIAILCTVVTRDVRTTRYYLAILICGDVSHIYANYADMGSEVFWNFGAYNEVMFGNVWITLFLFVNRLATLSGAFGRLGR